MEESGIRSQLDEHSTKLNEITEPLKELKNENAALRKLLGVSTTTHFLSSSMPEVTRPELETSICSKEAVEYIPEKIRTRTFLEEMEWMKTNFNELRSQKETLKDGKEMISDETIDKIFSDLRSRATLTSSIKWTNHLISPLTGPVYYVKPGYGNKLRLPLWINGGKYEAICFEGSLLGRSYISGNSFINPYSSSFLCSYEIGATSLRITLFCNVSSNHNHSIQLGIGFSPAAVAFDDSLHSTLAQNTVLPDDWVMSKSTQKPIEIFVKHGKYCARAHATPGLKSVVHVEILETGLQDRIGGICNPLSFISGRSPKILQVLSNLASCSDEFTCVLEVSNVLNVPMKVRGYSYFKGSAITTDVLPLGVEIFFATGKTCIEAAIAYEIESTDLALIVAVKAEEKGNKFAAVFIPVTAIFYDDKLEKLLDQNQWNCLFQQKFCSAKDGEQLIQTRNIRINASMTDGHKSEVKIVVYTV